MPKAPRNIQTWDVQGTENPPGSLKRETEPAILMALLNRMEIARLAFRSRCKEEASGISFFKVSK